jgi:uncharacterized protein CbrC (UPF0167 family)
MTTYYLKNWQVVLGDDPYRAPEAQTKHLQGIRNDGKFVTTSAIVSAQGREITTYSGSVYILEEINPEYLNWILESGSYYSEDEPIRIIK